MSARKSRLDRLLAKHLGISPDAVRPLLAQRRIKVDGRIADAREQMVDGFSVITVDDDVVQSQAARYVMLHKPCGVLSATCDPKHPVVTDLIPAAEDLHIAGRLDLHASGLLLLTNDGAWSRRLSAPESGVCKRYEVTLRDPLNADYVAAFAAGMYFSFEDITTRPAQLEILGERTARVTLQEGRYHQIKRMFGRFRNPVLTIHRISIGALTLDAKLHTGQSRELTPDEVVAACRPG
ncbi:MAG: Ribosomal small subunit pseudouridine synthase [Pseudomonadota bacterium]